MGGFAGNAFPVVRDENQTTEGYQRLSYSCARESFRAAVNPLATGGPGA
jgi:hypothetical protein